MRKVKKVLGNIRKALNIVDKVYDLDEKKREESSRNNQE